ncbi:unnamed protein product [Lactuca virosa]|uniref:BHLH domain-containing protein n=1 Tax=Lactuca virosa TaxID=75947 RepID=A0AAU9LK63_9ASTR|nr:unnamed protein product [Lactuca virosa]
MEGGFQSLLLAGKYGVGDDNFSALANSEEAYFNRDLSFQSFNFDKSLSLMHYPYGSSTPDANLQSRKIGESSKEKSKWRCVEREEKPKRVKNEPSMEQFNFSPAIMFGQLPELQSVEQMRQTAERHFKQSYSQIATTTNPHMLEPTLSQFQLTPNYITPVPLRQIKPPIPPPAKFSNREKARRRRNTLSDKTRTLQKVLPWDKKMDTATTYEETYKYIKFLQAQISALESMPVASTSSSPLGSENPRQMMNQYGGLGKLNRQQLLEVLVNSPSAQTALYSKGCCIYSLEQLILFKDISKKNFFLSGGSSVFS